MSSLLLLLSAPPFPDLLAVAQLFAEESKSAGALILVVDGQALTVGAVHPRHQRVEAGLRVSMGQGVSGQVARNSHAIRLGADSPRNPLHRELLGTAESGQVARLCLPARGLDGQSSAVVSLWRGTERPYTDADLKQFQPYADLLGVRLQYRRLLNTVNQHRHERDQLIAAAISAQEAERRRIAFDLHDGVATVLASMSFHLSAAEMSMASLADQLSPPDIAAADTLAQARSQISTACSLSDRAYAETREAISGLHSVLVDDLGIVAALQSLADTAAGTTVRVHSDPDTSFTDLPDHAAAALFRIAQETMGNAVRHAEATHIALGLHRVNGAVILTTVDDGQGFDVRASGETSMTQMRATQDRVGLRTDHRPGHFGLASIAERCALLGASLEIDTRPEQGTTVTVELSL